MVVLHQLSHQENIDGYGVLAMVVVVVIGVAIFMTAPVDQRAVHGAHEEMNGQ